MRATTISKDLLFQVAYISLPNKNTHFFGKLKDHSYHFSFPSTAKEIRQDLISASLN
jgi:hypothetical protein